MALRMRVGSRRHVAAFFKHNGNQDGAGTPTLENSNDWDDVVLPDWYCEKLEVVGGEVLRGRQVTATTRVVLFGDYAAPAAARIDATMKCKVAGTVYNVINARDVDGDSHEMRVELGWED